jgi:hypothetical protein
MKGHIVPVYENPDVVKTLIKKASNDGLRPTFWHIPTGSYAEMGLWKGFNLDPSWLVPTKDGRKVLIVEADASVGEEALALGKGDDSNDLDLSEAGQAFVTLDKLLKKVVAEKGVTGEVSLMRVFLIDTVLPVLSGAGRAITQRQAIELHNEADVIIDAKKPLLRAVHQWLEKSYTKALSSGSTSGSRKKSCVFDTRNQEYYKAMAVVLNSKGWQVLDRPTMTSIEGSSSGTKKSYDGVDSFFLVYEASTADTVHEVRQLIRNGLKPENICALLDRAEGVEELELLSNELSQGGNRAIKIDYVCSSALYDDLFTMVRSKIRDGDSKEKIQQWLDGQC